MTSGIQNTVIKNMASDGCYFLDLCEISERLSHNVINPIEVAVVAMKAGWVKEDFTVMQPNELLQYMTGRKIAVTITKDKPTECLAYVEKWHNDRTGFSHFKLPDWDSLTNSVTVREGYIESYRVLKEVR